MTSSVERARAALIKVLSDKSYQVTALSGKWGTGKTHLWRDVAHTLGQAEARPLFVSVFGARTIVELKMRLLQNASFNPDKRYETFIKAGGIVAKGFFNKFMPGGAAESLALLSLPSLLKERLVVIDDIERKHKDLHIDELLGFISEYSEGFKTQFLLLLNSDKLDDQALWQAFHEKVIDTEIILDPSPREAFEIAKLGKTFPYLEEVCSLIEIMKINNIRVSRRIIRVADELLGRYPHLPQEVLNRVLPCTVFFTAIHYRGLTDAPTIDYVLNRNSFDSIFAKDGEKPDEEKAWDGYLDRLKIVVCDEYDRLTADYLKTGMYDENRLDAVISQYRTDIEKTEYLSRLREFFRICQWETSLEPDRARQLIESFLPDAHFLGPGDTTRLSQVAADCGESELGDRFIVIWVDNFKKAESTIQMVEEPFDDPLNHLHPSIRAEIERVKGRKFSPLTIAEAMLKIERTSSWGKREEAAFATASIDDYIEALQTLSAGELQEFVRGHFSLFRTQGLSVPLAAGLETFCAACRRVCQSQSNSRLATILRREFDYHGKSDRLEERADASTDGSDNSV